MNFFLASNTNLLNTNSIWNSLKKNKLFIDDYNKILISLSDEKIITKYNSFFNVIYLNDYLKLDYKKIINLYKKIVEKNKDKKFFFLIYLRLFGNYEKDNENKKKSLKIYNEFLNIKTNNILAELITAQDEKIFSDRNNYYLRCPFSQDGIIGISSKINNHILNTTSKTFKLIILDCDNTLWGGTIGEDGIESIKYSEDGNGKIFLDVQEHLSNLKKQGFLLSISSKNNEKDVWETMKKRKMLLSKKDFLFPKINWNEKYLNISKTLEELSLKEDDVLFIDDNRLEREKIRKKFPKMSLLKFDNLDNYLSQLMQHPRLQKFHILKEDKKKYHQYKLKNKYHDLKATGKEIEKVYFELKQKIKWLKLNSSNINRAEQLFNKTNQFNFTVNRHNKEQLKKINNSKNHFIRLFSLQDKFGDHGIIGAIIYKKMNNVIYVSDFLISCRVLSRKIEEYVIYNVLKQHNIKKGYIFFKKTEKNFELISNFLKNNFFSKSVLKDQYEKKFTKKEALYQINYNKKLEDAKKFFKK